MKKLIICLGILIFIFQFGTKKNSYLIPEDAIRYRVIANSNKIEDQQIKYQVRDALEEVLNPIMLTSKTKQEVKTKILNSTSLLESRVKKTLEDNKVSEDYQINYGLNSFPKKEYMGVTYPEGEYESLIVTLGRGEGNNFWCVLFPPLCLLEGEKTDSEKVEYTSFIQEIISSFFKK